MWCVSFLIWLLRLVISCQFITASGLIVKGKALWGLGSRGIDLPECLSCEHDLLILDLKTMLVFHLSASAYGLLTCMFYF